MKKTNKKRAKVLCISFHANQLPRRLYLPILAFAMEFVFSKGPFPEWTVLPIEYGLLLWFVVSNLRGRGSWPYWIGVGTLSNLLVIALNGFKMPVWPTFLEGGGKIAVFEAIMNGEFFGYIPVTATTRLACLADVIGISFQGSLIGFASLGDVFLLIGVVVLLGRIFRTSTK